jgi:hypothetical protein|nr:MAG TPA: hypothetical protein [Crassvirales sp.]
MSRRTTNQAEVQNPVQASEVVNAAEQQQVVNDVFAQFMSEDEGSERSREDIIKELIASGNAKRLDNLTVKNVVATEFDTHALLTFVVKEFVIGDTRDANEVDAFGQPVVKLGKTHNVQTSSYAVAGVMKDSAKLAIFATDVVDTPQVANMLFVGAKIDVVIQFVAAGEEYVNPFASNPEPVVFERDKMIHHIVALNLGEVGQDMYHARLMK